MAISALVKDGPYFTSGQISFGQLRSVFRPTLLNENIRASDYRRSVTYTKIPVVPDATENASISTSNNLALSQYRNSIKSLSLTQTGTDTDLQIDGLSGNWNGNIARNIPKYFYLNGIIGQSAGSYALQLLNTIFNLKVVISGFVLGRGGSGGTGGPYATGQAGNPGFPGGTALFVNTSVPPLVFDVIDGISYRNYPVDVIMNGGLVFGGGGGGSGGKGGDNGPVGTCSFYSDYWTGYACGSVPSCGGATYLGNQSGGGCNCSKKGCANTQYRSRCRSYGYYQVRGGYGGAGGPGATGRGFQNYNPPAGLAGGGGGAGEVPFCNTYYFVDGAQVGGPGGVGSYGGNGGTGGFGGEWGNSGETASGSFSGGGPGRSIVCQNVNTALLTGTTGVNNIKGPLVNVNT